MKTVISSSHFPIEEVVPAIRHQLSRQNTLLISAPPGAGKSTILPIALLHEDWLNGQKIIMLEPRRLATRAIAERMSDLLKEPVGRQIGYRIRFESKISSETRIEVVTEGILTRMLQQDNLLEGVGMVIFDEFHERSLFADVALALCREVQQILRPELRIVIMSATLELAQLKNMLQAPIVDSPGRLFPVEIRYEDTFASLPIGQGTAKAILKAVKEETGDVLAFLPGEAEIRQCEELLSRYLSTDFSIHPLYGMLPHQQQQEALIPHPQGKRKIVLATSIAETSLTIEGIRIVVDSGYARMQRYNPATALTRLETELISQDRAQQRTGRAGRLCAGICYRLWSRTTQERLSEHRTPEIEEADLTSFALDMAQWGVQDISDLSWITPPPQKALSQAYQLLAELGAVSDHQITPMGRKMNLFSCHPRMAHMLLCAQDLDAVALATDVAAILEERDPLAKEAGVDLNLRVEALRRMRSQKNPSHSWQRIEKAASAYRKQFSIDPDNGPVDVWLTGLLVALAYPERIAQAMGNGIFQLSGSTRARIDLADDMAHEEWISIAAMDGRDGIGKIFLASSVRTSDLLPFATERDVISWDTRKGGVVAQRETRYSKTLLKSRPLVSTDTTQIQHVICEAIRREGEQLLDFNEAVQQWQNRVLSLRVWQSEANWPNVSTAALLESCEEWLLPYLEGKTKVEELKRINLKEVLQFHLPYELQQQLDILAPATIEVPSGSKIRLQYFPDGRQPILAVRLQECFGMAQTPRVCQEQIRVVMHFLSPGFKPVQITSDLESFWNNAYYDVKKELKSRYPKHVWPDNPWEEQAVRGIKRKK